MLFNRLFVGILIVMGVVAIWLVLPAHPIGIVKKQISKDGISVVYIQDKDTFALDYLSHAEYDSLCAKLSAAPVAYYYNAYAPGYDEYFVLKSYQPLPIDTITHFDDKAVSTSEKTGYTAKILSPYAYTNYAR